MSVQLILYPQIRNGYSGAWINSQQVLADGYFDTGLSVTTGVLGTYSEPLQQALDTSIPIAQWKGFHTTAIGGAVWGSVAAPYAISNTGLYLGSNSTMLSSTGVYQMLYNLVAGQVYDITIEIISGSSSGTGSLFIGNSYNSQWTTNSIIYNSVGFNQIPTTAGTHNIQFTAGASEEVFTLDYWNSNGDTLVISNISIIGAISTGSSTTIQDGQVICDLYEEEAIPLSLSVDDFKNVAEKVQSYSKDFHLPNTKRNNKIFGHIFEISRADDGILFNPYLKTRAVLKENSYTLFEGFLRLIDINDKEGEVSYNVNLFSEPVTLADILKERTFNDLDFDELEHQYTKVNIENSWAGNLALDNTLPPSSYAGSGTTTNVLKYPLVDWTSNKHIDSTGVVQFDNLQDAFRPFIKVKYLIDRIISEAEFDYTSNFLSTADFSNIYMDFNWGSDFAIANVNNIHRSWRRSDSSYLTVSTWNALSPTTIVIQGVAFGNYDTFNITNKRFEEDTDATTNVVDYTIYIDNDSSFTRNVDVRWLKTSGSTTTVIDLQTSVNVSPNATFKYDGTFTVVLNDGDTLQAQCNPAATSDKIRETYNSFDEWAFNTRTITSTKINHQIKNLRGELNQWEFLKGIMTMFNLVVIKENEILRIEPYSDIFLTNANSTQHNWTDKVDVSEINLKPLELVKRTKFTYEEDESDYALGVYKKATGGYLYGTKNFDATAYTILQDEEEIIATPFAPTIIKPIFDAYDSDFIIPTIYSGNEDGTEFEGFENAPRIMYDIQTVNLPVGKYSAPLINPQFNGKQEYRQFGHINELPLTANTKDVNFGECMMISVGGSTPLNLFNEYWLPYYSELYHPDTRIMTLKVNLTPADIENFMFYDTVVIKNREYRVNKIEYKPNTLAKVEFILIP